MGIADPESDDKDKADESRRIKNGEGHNFLWLRQVRNTTEGDFKYVTLLFEFVDQSIRSFPVVHTKKLSGREIEGDEDERGGVSAHLVVRLPVKGQDDGNYRCAIEVAEGITRSELERFIGRQLRRQARAEDFTFSVDGTKGGKRTSKEYRFNPRLEFFADIGRKLDFAGSDGRELSHMVFTKRHEKRSIGKPTAAKHEDIVADVELRVSAKQGPEDPQERTNWAQFIRNFFDAQGYESRMYYRHLSGGMVSGEVHHSLQGATDLVMCQKELISLPTEPKRWYPAISTKIVDQMTVLLDKDELWERGK